MHGYWEMALLEGYQRFISMVAWDGWAFGTVLVNEI